MNNIIVLIATTPRLSLITEYALPSVADQIHTPAAVVIISDKRRLLQEEELVLQSKLRNIPLYTLSNSRPLGAAGSWNTGIDFIAENFPDSYIAIIDDDDLWHPEHLVTCLNNSDSGNADVILSGINVKVNNETVAMNIPTKISVRDFLLGNPGWQGSNTFIKSELASKVGGFTDGLISCNDRDFAIRVLEFGGTNISYTNMATVDWMCNQTPDALSAPGSRQKLKGSAQFLQLHGNKMSAQDMDTYFNRAYEFFSLSKEEILNELKRLSGGNA